MYNTRQGIAHIPLLWMLLTRRLTESPSAITTTVTCSTSTGWPLQLVEPSIMPELPRTQKLSCESTASENTWCFDRPRPPTRLPFLIPFRYSVVPLFRIPRSVFYRHPWWCRGSWSRLSERPEKTDRWPWKNFDRQRVRQLTNRNCSTMSQAHFLALSK